MKFSSACISVALIALAASIIPAEGADWNNGAGGIKDHGAGGIPVPAPIPYQETYKYYLRADLGLSWNGSGQDLRHSGFNYGTGDLVAPLSMNSFAQMEHSKGLGFPATLGAGLYISDRWRADLTVDIRRKTQSSLGGAYSYVADNDAGLAAGGPATGFTSTGLVVGPTATAADSSTVSGFAQETLSNRATVLMANFYYDFGQRAHLTPYVGFGLGFAHNRYEFRARDAERDHHPAGWRRVRSRLSTRRLWYHQWHQHRLRRGTHGWRQLQTVDLHRARPELPCAVSAGLRREQDRDQSRRHRRRHRPNCSRR